MLTILILFVLISYADSAGDPVFPYTWLEDSDKFDAVVGISTEIQPICTGVLINKFSAITAANPIYINVEMYTHGAQYLWVHAIAGGFDKRVTHIIESIQFQSRCRSMFRPLGTDNLHSPIHDIVVLLLDEPMQTFTEIIYLPFMASWGATTTTRIVRFPPYRKREYTMRPIIDVLSFKDDGWFSMAGHGFVDRPHVKQNVDLELVEYQVSKVLLDCDDWIPRGWGRFICLSNIESLVGITAGGPLFYNRRFIGIGAFAVFKGNESILVFTDLRKYKGMKTMRGYINVLPDNTKPGFNPDNVTPVRNYFYLNLHAVGPREPALTIEKRYPSFYV